ncbi:MAG: lysophospholipid acyltransferase family protein [Caulobacterales bacterium]|nr:lysophospholipid acyltransferase family protein [Caulobacterales bacterium]
MAVRHSRSLGSRLSGLAYDAYTGLFGAMPVERASATGAALFKTIGPLLPEQKIARVNIARAFPDAGPDMVAGILSGMWDNLGRFAAEFPHLPAFRAYEPGGRIEVAGAERLDDAAASGKGAVLISGHFANWEVMAAAIVHRGVPCHVTYRPTNNAYVNQRIIDTRAAYGVTLQAAKGKTGGMGLLRALKKGEMVAVLNDQKNNEGVAAPFFGHDAMTSDGPTRLARRFGCPIIPMSVLRLPGVRFRVTVHEPIAVSEHEDEEAAIADTVGRINRFMEARIREAPEQWFWVHRRWPREMYQGLKKKRKKRTA